MIVDLKEHPGGAVDADVVIVGAGIAGLLLAVRLRTAGLKIVVLETGARQQTEPTHPLNKVVQVGDEYRGAEHGRFRCLGGTSSRWGGALLPFAEADFAARRSLGVPAWPVEYAEVMRHLPAIEKLFGLDSGSFDEQFVRDQKIARDVPIDDADVVARFAKWPAFGKRNVAQLFDSRLQDAGVTIFLDATVTAFDLDTETALLRGVTARSDSGKRVEVRGKQFALCAGAIESTRLLLLLDRQYRGRPFASCEALGKYFHDHVSMAAAKIRPKNVARLNRLAGFRFVGDTLRSLRYELSVSAQAADGVGSVFGHIGFESLQVSGFDALRNLLRNAQQTSGIRWRDVGNLLADAPYLATAAYWRFARRQLRWPTPAKYHLQVVVEQLPIASNTISLANDTDEYGVPRAQISWRVGSDEHLAVQAFQSRFDAFWKRRGLSDIGDLDWQADSDQRPIDIFHPGGTTRMGANIRSGVVDANLQSFAIPNLSVASTSTFPSGASANPTLMLMLFTERLAGRLAEQLVSRSTGRLPAHASAVAWSY